MFIIVHFAVAYLEDILSNVFLWVFMEENIEYGGYLGIAGPSGLDVHVPMCQKSRCLDSSSRYDACLVTIVLLVLIRSMDIAFVVSFLSFATSSSFDYPVRFVPTLYSHRLEDVCPTFSTFFLCLLVLPGQSTVWVVNGHTGPI